MKHIHLAIISVVILTFAVSIVAYPVLPDMIPSHWDASGQVDGYLPKTFGVFMVPLIMAGFSALLVFIPRIDPKRANYEKFQPYYDGFVLVFALFLFMIQLMVLLWALGIPVSPNLLFPVLVGALFFYIGILLDHAEPNWFVGIRTPWTLSSQTVWKKTHKHGALAFRIAGAVIVLGILVPEYAVYLILVMAIGTAIYTILYSYREYQNEQRESL